MPRCDRYKYVNKFVKEFGIRDIGTLKDAKALLGLAPPFNLRTLPGASSARNLDAPHQPSNGYRNVVYITHDGYHDLKALEWLRIQLGARAQFPDTVAFFDTQDLYRVDCDTGKQISLSDLFLKCFGYPLKGAHNGGIDARGTLMSFVAICLGLPTLPALAVTAADSVVAHGLRPTGSESHRLCEIFQDSVLVAFDGEWPNDKNSPGYGGPTLLNQFGVTTLDTRSLGSDPRTWFDEGKYHTINIVIELNAPDQDAYVRYGSQEVIKCRTVEHAIVEIRHALRPLAQTARAHVAISAPRIQHQMVPGLVDVATVCNLSESDPTPLTPRKMNGIIVSGHEDGLPALRPQTMSSNHLHTDHDWHTSLEHEGRSHLLLSAMDVATAERLRSNVDFSSPDSVLPRIAAPSQPKQRHPTGWIPPHLRKKNAAEAHTNITVDTMSTTRPVRGKWVDTPADYRQPSGSPSTIDEPSPTSRPFPTREVTNTQSPRVMVIQDTSTSHAIDTPEVTTRSPLWAYPPTFPRGWTYISPDDILASPPPTMASPTADHSALTVEGAEPTRDLPAPAVTTPALDGPFFYTCRHPGKKARARGTRQHCAIFQNDESMCRTHDDVNILLLRCARCCRWFCCRCSKNGPGPPKSRPIHMHSSNNYYRKERLGHETPRTKAKARLNETFSRDANVGKEADVARREDVANNA